MIDHLVDPWFNMEEGAELSITNSLKILSFLTHLVYSVRQQNTYDLISPAVLPLKVSDSALQKGIPALPSV